jgi:hypothetical protein
MTTGSLDTFPQVQKSFSRGSPTTSSYSKAQYCRLVAKSHNIRLKTFNKWAIGAVHQNYKVVKI